MLNRAAVVLSSILALSAFAGAAACSSDSDSDDDAVGDAGSDGGTSRADATGGDDSGAHPDGGLADAAAPLDAASADGASDAASPADGGGSGVDGGDAGEAPDGGGPHGGALSGEIVVYRIGNVKGGVVDTSAVFLDVYRPDGTLVRSIDAAVTEVETLVSGGGLTLAGDGNSVVYGGSAGPDGGVAVGHLTVDGAVTVGAPLTGLGEVRSAATVDGTTSWVATSGGLYAISAANFATGVTTGAPDRDVLVFENRLYYSDPNNVGDFPTPLPTTRTNPNDSFAGSSEYDSYGFVLFDTDASTPGPDLLYVTVSNGLEKWTYGTGGQGNQWTLEATTMLESKGGGRSVTGHVVGQTVTLYATSNYSTSAFKVVDTVSGTGQGAVSVFATPGASSVFRGIAMFPPAP